MTNFFELTIKNGQYSAFVKLMGNMFSFTAIHDHQKDAEEAIAAGIHEVQRIEKMLTTFSSTSETALINDNAGISPVVVSDEVFQLIFRCQKISELTQGAFDITYGSIHKDLWNFNTGLK